jgi:hypothetical protein
MKSGLSPKQVLAVRCPDLCAAPGKDVSLVLASSAPSRIATAD